MGRPLLSGTTTYRNHDVMSLATKVGLTAILTFSSAILAGCGGSSSMGPPPPRQLIAVGVQPATASAIAPDGTIPFSATGTFSQPPVSEANLAVQWTSSDPSIATVDPNSGVATCVAVGGPVTVTGSASGNGNTVQGSGMLKCEVSPNPVVKFDPFGLTAQCRRVPVCECFFTTGNQATLTNVGGAPLNIDNISISPPNITTGPIMPFSETNDCGSTLDPGQSCTIKVGLDSTHVHGLTIRGDVLVTDSGPGSPHGLPLVALSACGR